MKLLPVIWVTSVFRRRRAGKDSRPPGVLPAPTPAAQADRTPRPPASSDRTKTAIATAAIGVTIVAGIATATMWRPDPPATTASTTGGVQTYAQPSPSITASPTPTPSPTPVVPAVYGDTELAGDIAQGEGYDSMSAACEAGVEWTCHIHKVTPAPALTLGWHAYIGVTTLDGDSIAQELLDRAPGTVSAVKLSYVPHDGQILTPVSVGHAARNRT